MVDWDLVDKRRAKGWDWDRIAADPKVGFHAEESAGEPGRALRALYYQRRSKAKRQSGDSGTPGAADEPSGGSRGTSRLARIGFILAPMFAIWLVLGLAFPSIIGTIGDTTVSAIPYIGLALAAGAFILGFGLLRSVERWTPQFRTALTIGIVLGLVLSGAVALVSIVAGCPNLTAATTGEPQNWSRAPNAAWSSNGEPTFFFYGAVACPYCSASSWVVWYALAQFGQWNGVTFSHSSPTDVYPNTPSVDLSSAGFQSQWVAPVLEEGPNPNTIMVPSIGCPDSAYVSNYDSGGSIPFEVLNGQFVHAGSLIDPTYLRSIPGDGSSSPLSASQAMGQINNESGTVWDQVSGPAQFLEAMILYVDGGQGPKAVVDNSAVQSQLAQIR
jgi:hypothetical protein